MRTVVAVLAWLIAVVAGLVALPTAWVGTHVTSEDGWVAFTASFATDPKLEDALVDEVSAQLAGQNVPPTFRAVVREGVAAAARRTVDDPGWTKAWRESQRRSHSLVLHADDTDRLTIDIAPLADYVLTEVTGGLPVPVSAPDRLLVAIDADVEPSTFERIRQAPDTATAAGVAAIVAVVVVLFAARRRGLALVALGVGGLIVAGVGLLGAAVVLPAVADHQTTATTSFAQTVNDLLIDRVRGSFSAWAFVLAGISAVVTAVGGVAAAIGARRA